VNKSLTTLDIYLSATAASALLARLRWWLALTLDVLLMSSTSVGMRNCYACASVPAHYYSALGETRFCASHHGFETQKTMGADHAQRPCEQRRGARRPRAGEVQPDDGAGIHHVLRVRRHGPDPDAALQQQLPATGRRRAGGGEQPAGVWSAPPAAAERPLRPWPVEWAELRDAAAEHGRRLRGGPSASQSAGGAERHVRGDAGAEREVALRHHLAFHLPL